MEQKDNISRFEYLQLVRTTANCNISLSEMLGLFCTELRKRTANVDIAARQTIVVVSTV